MWCLKCISLSLMLKSFHFFPLRRVWNVSPLHATSLPIKDLPKFIHTSHGKWPWVMSLWGSLRVLLPKICFINCGDCRAFTPSPMASWGTPCTTPCSMPPSACAPGRSWTTAGGADSRWVTSVIRRKIRCNLRCSGIRSCVHSAGWSQVFTQRADRVHILQVHRGIHC